jgi:hypothetical protein
LARIFRLLPRQRRQRHELRCDVNNIGVRSFVLSGAPFQINNLRGNLELDEIRVRLPVSAR